MICGKNDGLEQMRERNMAEDNLTFRLHTFSGRFQSLKGKVLHQGVALGLQHFPFQSLIGKVLLSLSQDNPNRTTRISLFQSLIGKVLQD